MIRKNKERDFTFVTVKIGEEVFGINVSRVKEVTGLTEITRIPDTMPFMKGIINLRGKSIPLVDMRIRFGLQEKEYDRRTVILISKIRGKFIGLIVDSVLDVIILDSDIIQQTPHFSIDAGSDSFKGVAQLEDRTVIILDVDSIFSEDEISGIA